MTRSVAIAAVIAAVAALSVASWNMAEFEQDELFDGAATNVASSVWTAGDIPLNPKLTGVSRPFLIIDPDSPGATGSIDVAAGPCSPDAGPIGVFSSPVTGTCIFHVESIPDPGAAPAVVTVVVVRPSGSFDHLATPVQADQVFTLLENVVGGPITITTVGGRCVPTDEPWRFVARGPSCTFGIDQAASTETAGSYTEVTVDIHPPMPW